MEKIILSHHLVRVYGIKERNIKDWEEVLLDIQNLNENHDKNSAIAGYIQMLKDLRLFECKKRKFLKLKLKEYIENNNHK